MTEPVMCVDIVIQSNKIEWKEKSGRGEKKKKRKFRNGKANKKLFNSLRPVSFPIVDVRTATEGVIHVRSNVLWTVAMTHTHTYISDCVSDGRNSDKLYTTTQCLRQMCLFYRASQLAHMAHFRDNKTKDCWRGKKKPQSEKCDDGIQAARHYDQIKK